MNPYILPFLWMRGEDESILRNEIEKIAECEIGALCVEARPHDDFCGPGWWHDMDIVLEEAKKRGMRVWILDDKHFPTGYAAGLIEKKYPERKKLYLGCTTADVFGSSRPLTLDVQRMCKPTIGFWEIGNPVDYAEQAKNTLLSLTALRFAEGSLFTGEAIDLSGTVKNGAASFTLPEGQWRVHALYRTRTGGGDETYINMLDSQSAHTQIEGVYEAHYARYASEFGSVIAGFFSDEPQFGNLTEQCFDTKLGRKKMLLPWSGEMEELLLERLGPEAYCRLPFLFASCSDEKVQAQVRFSYMDLASRLYAKNFCRPIGEWCRSHGVEYIGHVVEDNGVHSRLGLGAGHYFRAMSGQDMAGIDIIGGQYYYGAPAQERKAMTECDGEFFHYCLGKLGASAGHLDPKKKGRTLCELFGAYGWGFGVRDMKHLLDHVLSRGVNHLVPHAFSMAEYPDIDCPPHFYARGHNPEFPYFARLMVYAGRLLNQLNGGTHVPEAAVLYDGELDWAGDHLPMQKVCRVLTEHQIEYDIISLDMLNHLEDYQGSLAEGRLTINGASFAALLVPEGAYVPASLASFAANKEGFPVFFLEHLPKGVLEEGESSGDCICLSDNNECSHKEAALSFLSPEQALTLEELPSRLRALGAGSMLAEPAFVSLSIYRYWKEGDIYFLLNESASEAFSGTVTLPSAGPLYAYDALRDTWQRVKEEQEENRTKAFLPLLPGQSCLLSEKPEEEKIIPGLYGCGSELPLSRELSSWLVSCLFAAGEAEGEGETATSWREEAPLSPVSDRLPFFSGTIRYETELTLNEVPREAVLEAEQLFEVGRLLVNGKEADLCLTPPYRFDTAGLLQKGENHLLLEAATTPARDQKNYPQPPFDFSHEALEPTGLMGKVTLWYR